MKNRDLAYLMDIIDNEGFDYAFKHYSSFEQIEDEEFHNLRKQYLETREKLEKYIGLEDN